MNQKPKPSRLEEYQRKYKNFEAALDSVIAWHSKAVELAHATYDVPPAAIKEVEVKKITKVTKTGKADSVIQTVKGENRTGDPIELRVNNYKNTNKIEASFLYKGKKQAYIKETFIGDTFGIELENYENPDLSTTIEVTPHDTRVSPWVFAVKVVQQGIVIKDTVTLEDKDPDLVKRIIYEIKPTGWVPIAALDPAMVGAVIPENAGSKLKGWLSTTVKVGLCIVGTGAFSAASNSGAGLIDTGAGSFNVVSFL